MLKAWRIAATVVSCAILLGSGCALKSSRSGSVAPMEGFAAVNGVRLEYLDWGGSGLPLILIHGLGADPHYFDDLAPAFTDQFHVVAYARRGSGSSDANGPYDVDTLTEDLRGLMDSLGFAKAILVGYSAGGNEVTEMAAEHPERVERIVYLDGAYDYADPDYGSLYAALPAQPYEPPEEARSSLQAYLEYQHKYWYPELSNLRPIEPYLREAVVLQQDGTVMVRLPKERMEALTSAFLHGKRRDFARIRCPVLALFAQHIFNVHASDPTQRAQAIAWDEKYWAPFQAKSIDRLQRELKDVRIVSLPGRHVSFFLTDREQVIRLMRQFLIPSA